MNFNKQSGQGVVEYILLLAVAISLVLTFYRSQAFKRLFGEQGQLGNLIKQQTEYNYRHALGRKAQDVNLETYSGTSHPSYFDSKSGATRFFGPKEPY